MRVQISNAGIEYIREAIVVNAMTDLKWGYKTLLKYESDEQELMMQCKQLNKKIKKTNLRGKAHANALKQYRAVCRKLDNLNKAKLYVNECENFFKSAWFKTLVDLDGERILRKIKEDALEHNNKRTYIKHYERKNRNE